MAKMNFSPEILILTICSIKVANIMKVIYQIAIALIIILCCGQSAVSAKDAPLIEGDVLPSFTLVDGKKKITFPDDFAGKPFALYFGNLICNQDGYEFLSWGGAYTIALRQKDDSLHDMYFAGIASLKKRPLYWVPFMVRKTINGEMKKNDVRGKLFYDFKGDVAKRFKIKTEEVRAIVVDKDGVIRKVFDSSVYSYSEDELEDLYHLFQKLTKECGDER